MYSKVSPYPSIRRDLALQIDESVSYSSIKMVLDNMEITESEVIIKMPFELKIKIPKDSFGKECSIKEAVSKAISQAISHPVSVNK